MKKTMMERGILPIFLIFVSFFLPVNVMATMMSYDGECQGPIAGDCNPYSCGGVCEAKYVRFYDSTTGIDRTTRSCSCQQERICSILGMSTFSGCKSYAALSSIGQKYVRYWSMSPADKKNRHTNNAKLRYSDKVRHVQLFNGNSRFCCRSTVQKRLAMHLKSSSNPAISLLSASLLTTFIAFNLF